MERKRLMIIIPITILCNILLASCSYKTNDKVDNPYPFMELENIRTIKYAGDNNSGYQPISISPNDEWLIYQSAPSGSLLAYNLESHKTFLILYNGVDTWGKWKEQEGIQEFQLDYHSSVQLPFNYNNRVIKHKLSYDELTKMRDIYNFTSDIIPTSDIYKQTDYVGGTGTIQLGDNEYIMFIPINKEKTSVRQVVAYQIVYQKDGVQTLLKTIKAKFISSKMHSMNISVNTGSRNIKISLNKRFIAVCFIFWHYHRWGSWGKPAMVHRYGLYLIDLWKKKASHIDDNFGVFYSPEEPLIENGDQFMAFDKEANRLFYISHNEIKCLKLND